MDRIKRQDLPKGLWVVATPIGNLSDVSERGRGALLQADAVLCEDTRRTAKLLAAIGDPHPMARLERFDAHASGERLRAIVQRLLAGESLALVTDAGTPGISDPGGMLVQAAREAGVGITPVPGPSAVTALLSVAGITETAFTFLGFFPRGKADGERLCDSLGATPLSRVFVWFESPERVEASLELIARRLPEARIFAAKELTKIHERFFSGFAPEVAEAVREEHKREGMRGEWCVALLLPRGGEVGEQADRQAQDEVRQAQSSDWVKALQCLLDLRISAADAAKQVSRYFDVPKRTVYERALRLLGKKN